MILYRYDCCNTTCLFIFKLVTRHNYNSNVVLPQHVPEVVDCVWHRTLRGYVSIGARYALHTVKYDIIVNS